MTTATKAPTGAILLEQWGVAANIFRAPETGGQHLIGVTYGDPRAADGRHVTTSPIVSADGKLVVTQTGTVYALGEPDPAYLAFLRSENIPIDLDHPITIRRRVAAKEGDAS